MNSIFLGLITFTFLVLAGFVVYVLLEVKITLISLRQYMTATEDILKSAAEELHMSLRSLRKITDNIGIVTDDVKEFSASLQQIGRNAKQLSSVVGTVTTTSCIQVAGFKAGIRAGFGYFLKNFLSKNKQEVTYE